MAGGEHARHGGAGAGLGCVDHRGGHQLGHLGGVGLLGHLAPPVGGQGAGHGRGLAPHRRGLDRRGYLDFVLGREQGVDHRGERLGPEPAGVRPALGGRQLGQVLGGRAVTLPPAVVPGGQLGVTLGAVEQARQRRGERGHLLGGAEHLQAEALGGQRQHVIGGHEPQRGREAGAGLDRHARELDPGGRLAELVNADGPHGGVLRSPASVGRGLLGLALGRALGRGLAPVVGLLGRAVDAGQPGELLADAARTLQRRRGARPDLPRQGHVRATGQDHHGRVGDAEGLGLLAERLAGHRARLPSTQLVRGQNLIERDQTVKRGQDEHAARGAREGLGRAAGGTVVAAHVQLAGGRRDIEFFAPARNDDHGHALAPLDLDNSYTESTTDVGILASDN